MVKLSKRTISLVLTFLLVISMVSFSGLSVTAATNRTTAETSAGTATYKVLMGPFTTAPAYVGGAMGKLTYPTDKLTFVSATVSSDFASTSANTAVAGTISWNAVGDVSYTANKVILTVNFTIKDGATVTASDFVGSDWQLITNSAANSPATVVFTTDGTGLTEEIGLPKADNPKPPEVLTLKEEVASDYKVQEQTLADGTKIKILLGTWPATKVTAFPDIIENTGVKILQNSADTLVTSGNIKSGYRVQTADGNDTWFIAVRGDSTAAGTCTATSRNDIVKALKARVANYANYSKTASSLTACKHFGATTASKATDTTAPNATDRAAMIRYIKSRGKNF